MSYYRDTIGYREQYLTIVQTVKFLLSPSTILQSQADYCVMTQKVLE